MNRDYWARFERFVQMLTNTCSDVWIITGPLYLPRPGKEGWRMDHALLGEPALRCGVGIEGGVGLVE